MIDGSRQIDSPLVAREIRTETSAQASDQGLIVVLLDLNAVTGPKQPALSSAGCLGTEEKTRQIRKFLQAKFL